MTADEYWALTPIEETALVEQWKSRENRRHIGTAQIIALLVNFFSDRGSSRYGPEDFLPFKIPPRYLTIEEADAMMLNAFEVKIDG